MQHNKKDGERYSLCTFCRMLHLEPFSTELHLPGHDLFAFVHIRIQYAQALRPAHATDNAAPWRDTTHMHIEGRPSLVLVSHCGRFGRSGPPKECGESIHAVQHLPRFPSSPHVWMRLAGNQSTSWQAPLLPKSGPEGPARITPCMQVPIWSPRQTVCPSTPARAAPLSTMAEKPHSTAGNNT